MAIRLEAPPPPIDSVRDPHGGGGGDWVTLFRARNDIDAALLVGRLEEAGVESRSIKDRDAPGAWLFGGSNPWAPVLVYVRRFQLTDARFVLAQVSFYSGEVRQPEHRPPDRDRVPLIWWATAVSLGVLLSALAVHQVADHKAFCQIPTLCERMDSTPDKR